MGLDREFDYADLWEDDHLVFSPYVQEQHELDWTEPACHDFRCPPDLWIPAMRGWPEYWAAGGARPSGCCV